MLIATLSPRDPHAREIALHPLVDALRFNTGVQTLWSRKETLERMLELCSLSTGPRKPLFIDLKARQLRVTKWADPRYECIELNHAITVNTPAQIWFRDPSPAKEHAATIVGVDGNRLLLADPPRYALGAGQAATIRDPSLVVHGFLTGSDMEYVEAAVGLGQHNYLLSFLEQEQDIKDLVGLDSNARICAKIESPAGLEFVRNVFPRYRGHVGLMAARDDLFLNIGLRKIEMLEAERLIVSRDPEAIAASRILTSLEERSNVSLGDLKDLESLWTYGYRNFMLSDGLCSKRDSFLGAMRVFEEFLEYVGKQSNEKGE